MILDLSVSLSLCQEFQLTQDKRCKILIILNVE